MVDTLLNEIIRGTFFTLFMVWIGLSAIITVITAAVLWVFDTIMEKLK